MSPAAALLLAAAVTGPNCPAWTRDTAARLERLETRLVELVNDARRTVRAPALEPDARVAAVARAHARTMARLRNMSHTAAGETLERRLRAAGIDDWSAVGENIAMGQSVDFYAQNASGGERSVACHEADSLARDVFRAWYASPGHRAALLDPTFTHVGSGAAYDAASEAVYVTHDFTRRVTCGFLGAPCCPPPVGQSGGVCQLPQRCRAGLCVVPASPPPTR